MMSITKLSNEDEMHYFQLIINNDFHNELINFLHDLKFSTEMINKIDTPFLELEGEYLFVKSKNAKIHLFIANSRVNMVIDWKITQKDLTKKMSPYFIFPKRT